MNPDESTPAPRAAVGSCEHINSMAWESMHDGFDLRDATLGLDHAPTEVVLTRKLTVQMPPKLMDRLRINGDVLEGFL